MTAYQDAVAVVSEAERTLIRAKWLICQEKAIERLSCFPGLGATPLFPLHPVIQIVVCDGALLGQARKHRTGARERWIAITDSGAREIGGFRTLGGAARALARAAGTRRYRRMRYLPQ